MYLQAESSFVKDEPRSARSSDNDNYDKQDQNHVAARSCQEPSAERQYNPPGSQSNPTGSNSDVRDSKSRKREATLVKKQGDPSSASSGNESSDEDAGCDRGRKHDDDRRRGCRDGRRRSKSRRSGSRSSSPKIRRKPKCVHVTVSMRKCPQFIEHVTIIMYK